jgi:hypothetical protein
VQILIAIILYALAICVTAYDKYCLVLDRWDKPPFYRNPVLYSLFFISKFGLWSISCILFYRTNGLWIASAAAVFYLAFGTILLRVFYRKRVAIWLPTCLKIIREEQSKEKLPMSEAVIMIKAIELAEISVRKAINDET